MRHYWLAIGLLSLGACNKKSVTLPLGNTIPITPVTAVSAKPLIVLATGQSNMSQENQSDEFPIVPSITILNGARVGPAYAFAMQYVNKHPGSAVTVVQTAWGGSPSSYWIPSQPAYDRVLHRLKMAEITHVDVVLHAQGEAEAMAQIPDNWPQNFATFVGSIRRDVGSPGTPIIFAQTGTIDPARWPTSMLSQVQNEQFQAQGPDVFMVSTQDLATVDGLHHDSFGAMTVGTRMETVYEGVLLGA